MVRIMPIAEGGSIKLFSSISWTPETFYKNNQKFHHQMRFSCVRCTKVHLWLVLAWSALEELTVLSKTHRWINGRPREMKLYFLSSL